MKTNNRFKQPLIFCAFFLLSSTLAKAQWVTIPDTIFANCLRNYVPNCMNGNQLDTTCSGVRNLSTLGCSNLNILDLTGVQYFDNLTHLFIKWNYITSLP